MRHAPHTLSLTSPYIPQAPAVLDGKERWAPRRADNRVASLTREVGRHAGTVNGILDGALFGEQRAPHPASHRVFTNHHARQLVRSQFWQCDPALASPSLHFVATCREAFAYHSLVLNRTTGAAAQSCPKVILHLHPVSHESRRARPLSEWVCATPSADACKLGLAENGKTVSAT